MKNFFNHSWFNILNTVIVNGKHYYLDSLFAKHRFAFVTFETLIAFISASYCFYKQFSYLQDYQRSQKTETK